MPVAKKVRECPGGKELKPSTGRCVKKCKPNRVREPISFKCIKNPKNHVVNPITGRQVKRGYYHGVEKAQARILQAVVRRKIAKGKPSSGTPEQYKRMSPASRHYSSASSSASSASAKSNSSSLLGSPARSSRASLSSASRSSSASSAAAAHSVSSPRHIIRFMDGKREGEIVKIKRQR